MRLLAFQINYRSLSLSPEEAGMGSKALDLRVYRKSTLITEFRAEGDPDDIDSMRRLLAEAIARDGWDTSRISEFEMQVRNAGDRRLVTTFVGSWV